MGNSYRFEFINFCRDYTKKDFMHVQSQTKQNISKHWHIVRSQGGTQVCIMHFTLFIVEIQEIIKHNIKLFRVKVNINKTFSLSHKKDKHKKV